MSKAIKIESNEVYNSGVGMWFVLHSLYVGGEFVGKSSDIVDLISESGVDLNGCVISDEHTKEVLCDEYESDFIIQRYGKNV